MQYLMKFNVASVNRQTVKSAKLHLYATNPSNVGGILKRVSNMTWTETGVTWHTAPAQDTSTIASLPAITQNT
jgi:hypothetical protein